MTEQGQDMARPGHSREYHTDRDTGIIFIVAGLLVLVGFHGLDRLAGLLLFGLPGIWMLIRARRAERAERRKSFHTVETLTHPLGWLCVTGIMVVAGLCWWRFAGRARDWGLFTALVGALMCPRVLWWWWQRHHRIHHAAYAGETKDVARMVAADPEAAGRSAYLGRTPLHAAAAGGRPAVVGLLIRAQADVNARADGDWTALHWAAMGGYAEVVEMLLGAGAEVDARAEDATTPLYWAARNGHIECVRELLAAAADPNIPDSKGRTAVHVAEKKGHREVAELLRRHEAVE